MHHSKFRPLIGSAISFAAVAALLTGAWHARADTGRAAVAYSGSPATQTAPVGATGISVSIVAADVPAGVAISHFVVAYDSSLLRATGATCGSALEGTVAVFDTSTPGTADIGCSKLPAGTIYNSGTQTVATVTFDGRGVAGTSGQTLPTVELLDASQACIEGHDGSRCTAPGSPNAIGSITLDAAASAETPAASSGTSTGVRVAYGIGLGVAAVAIALVGTLAVRRTLRRGRAGGEST